MTAMEVLHRVQKAGGILFLDADRLCYDLPANANGLVDELRVVRDDIVVILKQGFADTVARWLKASCVVSRGCSANPKILYHEFSTSKKANDACTYDAFMQVLERAGFQLDEHGMLVGLCLAQDWIAAWQCEQAVLQ